MPSLGFALLLSAILWTILIVAVDAAMGWELLQFVQMQLAFASAGPIVTLALMKPSIATGVANEAE